MMIEIFFYFLCLLISCIISVVSQRLPENMTVSLTGIFVLLLPSCELKTKPLVSTDHVRHSYQLQTRPSIIYLSPKHSIYHTLSNLSIDNYYYYVWDPHGNLQYIINNDLQPILLDPLYAHCSYRVSLSNFIHCFQNHTIPYVVHNLYHQYLNQNKFYSHIHHNKELQSLSQTCEKSEEMNEM